MMTRKWWFIPSCRSKHLQMVFSCDGRCEDWFVQTKERGGGTNIPAPCRKHQYTNIYYTSTTHLFLMLPVHIPQYTNKRCWACFTQQYQMHTTFILNQFQAKSLLCIKESRMQDEILKKRLEPETKIVGIFWCKFFRADSNFAYLKRILGLFLLIWGIFTQHYFFGAKFPRQKVLIFMFCMFRPWTIVIYTQSAPFFIYTQSACFFALFETWGDQYWKNNSKVGSQMLLYHLYHCTRYIKGCQRI